MNGSVNLKMLSLMLYSTVGLRLFSANELHQNSNRVFETQILSGRLGLSGKRCSRDIGDMPRANAFSFYPQSM